MRSLRGVACVLVAVMLAAACGSSSSSKATGTGPPTTLPNVGQGVTSKTIKVGVMMLDYSCVAQYVSEERPDQQKDFQVFVDDLNKKGGIDGRTIVPVYKTFCPTEGNTGELRVCTELTEDTQVFAVVGTFYDPTGATQLCFAKKHHTIVIADSLTQSLVNDAPGGLLLTPDITGERRMRVIMALMAKKGTLNGKTVAIVSGSNEQSPVVTVVRPALKKLGVARGADAVLSINGSDTTAAQAQLDSFIEKWKSDGTNALIMVGSDVSSKQFVVKIKQNIPNMQLVADTTAVLTGAQDEQKAGVTPNPYEGIITAEGQTGLEHTKTPHFAYCRDIFEKATGQKVPSPNVVIKLKDGNQNQIYGSVEDGCLFVTFFADIAKRVGPRLTIANWVNTVNQLGTIDDTSTIFASIHKGKYDADDTYGLVAYDHSIGQAGDWVHLTPEQDVGSY
jgi:hypothetical protein